jgi:hypothetical protein
MSSVISFCWAVKTTPDMLNPSKMSGQNLDFVSELVTL